MEHPHFVLYVRDLVEKQIGPELMAKGGLRVYTTLDPKIQAAAEEEVPKQIAKLQAQGQNASDGALVAVRPATGEVLAMVGSADFHNDKIGGQINMAVAPRQPGSSIKPITYLAAFEMPAVAGAKGCHSGVGHFQRCGGARRLDALHGHHGRPDAVPRWRQPALCAGEL